MKHNYKVGSEEWKDYVVKYLQTVKDNFMKEGKDMRAYSLGTLTTELEEYFKTQTIHEAKD